MVALDPSPEWPRTRALIAAALLLVVELGAIGIIFKHSISFNCLANWPGWACRFASGGLVALYCAFGATVLFALLRPGALGALTARAGSQIWPLGMNLAGALIALVPVSFLKEGMGAAAVLPAFGFWGLGMGLLLGGLALFVAPLPLWRAFLSRHGTTLLPMLLAGASAPWLATQIRPLWRLDAVAGATFEAVSWVVQTLGYQVEASSENRVIGAGDFYIDVAPVCSGVEGLALVTVFVTLYLWLFRADLRFPRALWLYPVGMLVSALFNVLRISILLIIGLEGNPELAVGGFHSHAGWLLFTMIALGIVMAAQTVPALQKKAPAQGAARPQATPFFQDPVVARILPFIVFMGTALLASTLTTAPGEVYPWRALAMAAALALCWPTLRALPWRIDPLALAAGAAIAVMWIVIAPASGEAPYGTLAGGALALWLFARIIGTTLFVPVIEELFFRDYLMSRIAPAGKGWPMIVAVVVTTALFALLHDRWIVAAIAGLIFAALVWRSRNITDAILAHGAANGLIALYALITGAWHIL